MSRRFILALAGVVALAACNDESSPTAPVDAPVAEGRFKNKLQGKFLSLTLLHNNDAESALLDDEGIGGIARFADVVAELRAEGEDCGPRGRSPIFECDVILVSSGDNFLAGPEFQASIDNGYSPFYDAEGFDALKYDASAIGNHELDFGPGVLAEFISQVDDVPFVSANLDISTEGELSGVADRIAAFTIVETTGGAVGIVGATTERLREISSPGEIIVNDVLSSVQSAIDELESQGVDRIILISHLQSVEEDEALIGQLRGVDIAVAGGGDELLANPRNVLLPGDEPDGPYPRIVRDADGRRVPVVTTSGSLEYVGRLQVIFKGGRIQRILTRKSGPVAVIGGSQDPELLFEVEAPVAAEVEDLASTLVGSTQIELDGTRALVRTRETAYGSLIADAILAAAPGGADIALANGGGIRNSIVLPAGSDITRLDLFRTLPFANFVSTVTGVTPTRLKEVLENAVSRVEFVDGRFAQVSGLTFTYDAGAAAGSRIIDVSVHGTDYVMGGVVQSAPDLRLAIVNFLANGGDGYPLTDLPVETGTTTYQQALEDYIVDTLGGTVTTGLSLTGRIECVGGSCPS